MKMRALIIACLVGFAGINAATAQTVIRLGVLPFGSVNWEINAMHNAGLDNGGEFQLQVQTLANPEAAKIALQAGELDMMVTDWIWVSRQRGAGMDYTFHPYSTVTGALVVAQDSPIKTLADLQGKRLGIAGGELDKNWLLLQALALKQQVDLDKTTEKLFGAPPLLSQQLQQGRADALLTYWHYAAPLESKGYRQLLDGRGILRGLGVTAELPNLGYVFKRQWGDANRAALTAFFAAATQARGQLCNDAATWQANTALLQADDEATRQLLRQRYCDGSVRQWGATERQAAAQVYALLRKASADRLTGPAASIVEGTFWEP